MTPTLDDDGADAIARIVDGMLASRGESEPTDVALHTQAAGEYRIALALRCDGPAPSLALLSAVERQALGARGRRGRTARIAMRPAIAMACVAAVAIVAIVVGLTAGTGGQSPGSSLEAAAALALEPSHGAPPAAATATLLDAAYRGVTYPNYRQRFGSAPTGLRGDRIHGRAVLTVYYRLKDGARMSYTVFSGTPVSLPPHASTVVFEGVTLHSFVTSAHISVVTLVRHGRTCVLAARATPVRALLALAEWPLTVTAA